MIIWTDDIDYMHECFGEAQPCLDAPGRWQWYVTAFCKGNSGFWFQCHKSPFDLWDLAILEKNAQSSQYDRLLSMPQAQERRHVLCLAKTGAGFHGQGKSAWIAPQGNLYLSAQISTKIAANQAMNAVVLPCVSILEALVQNEPSLPVSIKWVNDILLDKRKLAGVLASVSVYEQEIRKISLGIGLNILSAPRLDNPHFVQACALSEYSRLSLAQVLEGLAQRLMYNIGVWEAQAAQNLLQTYINASYVLGKEVRLFSYSSEFANTEVIAQGVVAGILPDLSLQIAGYRESFRDVKLMLV